MQSLLTRLKADFPDFHWKAGKKFSFRAPRTITFVQLPENPPARVQNNYALQLLHELGHARLGHRDYATDPERLKMERAAWEEARQLCQQYEIEYDEDFVEDELDSYRAWLHQKSRCPECGLTRYQTKDGQYHCPGCEG